MIFIGTMVTDMDTAHTTAGDGECITIPIDMAMGTQVLATGVQDTMATVTTVGATTEIHIPDMLETLLITIAEGIPLSIITMMQPEAVI